MNKQKGFTLIELVVVIIILGILAATALPKFIDLSDDAANAAAGGVAGAIASATAINFGARKAGNASAVQVNEANAALCTSAKLQQFVDGVTLVDTAPASPTSSQFVVSGGAGTCATATSATCNITAAKGGSGLQAKTATITCAI